MQRAVERRGAVAVRHVHPVPPARAEGLVARVYEQARADFLLVPPFTLHSPVPEILAAVWSVTRETLVAGVVPRGLKEAVAAAVSRLNRCPYCVDAHLMALGAASGAGAVRAVERGVDGGDARLRALGAWAEATRTPGAEVLRRPPFSSAEAPELIGTVLAFHYINRMVSVFCEESPLPLPAALAGLRSVVRRLSAPMVMRSAARSHAPGASLALVPRVPLPDDLGWAATRDEIAVACAAVADAVERHARVAIPAAVLDLVRERTAGWHGEDPGLDRGWVAGAVASLPERERAAGRLALLTAFAAHRVDDAAVAEFRRQHPDDAALVALTAFASLAAARRVATWLAEPA